MQDHVKVVAKVKWGRTDKLSSGEQRTDKYSLECKNRISVLLGAKIFFIMLLVVGIAVVYIRRGLVVDGY